MERSLLAYNGFGTVIAILLWYGFVQVGVDPAIFFAGALAGILLCAGMSEKDAPWWAITAVLTIIAVVSVLAPWGISHANSDHITYVDAKHIFLVFGTLALGFPIMSRVHGHYRFDFEDIFPGVPAFLAFAWFVNLGVWWGVGAAFFMFSFQLGLAYWLLLQEKKLVNVLPA